MINYGIVYGLSDFGLAQRLGIERADAKRYIDGYLAHLRGARHATWTRIIEDAHRDGGARTLLGRFRPLPELGAQEPQRARMHGERMARNTPIQGTAADLLKLAMIAGAARASTPRRRDVEMLLTVHDELVLEAPEPTRPTPSASGSSTDDGGRVEARRAAQGRPRHRAHLGRRQVSYISEHDSRTPVI